MDVVSVDIQEKVQLLIAAQLGSDRLSHAVTMTELDVIDRIELIMRLEEEFSIEISDTEADALASVHDMVALVAVKRTSSAL